MEKDRLLIFGGFKNTTNSKKHKNLDNIFNNKVYAVLFSKNQNDSSNFVELEEEEDKQVNPVPEKSQLDLSSEEESELSFEEMLKREKKLEEKKMRNEV